MSGITLREAIFNRRMLICIATGFSSGLPLYVLIQLVPAWLRSEDVSLAAIGLFSLVGFPYTWKFLWSPLMERYQMPFLGRRRGWLLVTQLLLLLSIGVLGMLNPKVSIWTVAVLCGGVAFFSASQDIVLDAYRREILPDRELGLGNSFHVNAYRIAGLIPGALSLVLADILPWDQVFLITAAFMGVGLLMTLMVSEPIHPGARPKTLAEAVTQPFVEFFKRNGVRQALLVLTFMFLYKLGDNMATALATPFYLDMGYSKTEIGLVAKNAGLWPMVIGGILGGLLMVRIGINKSLWLFGVVQMASILGFILLSEANVGRVGTPGFEPNLWLLALVISFEYLGVGLGTAAFVAFIARTTSKHHTATQLALFTALTALPRTFANATTGFIVERVGWTEFYLICTALAVPGMLLLMVVAPWKGNSKPESVTVMAKPIERNPD
ncbi:AmpG family muropeptide MFS transporter [Microbulbifer rhizosphaerae]|uniref:PAT family beta-lactamase induction signal transducer AmpG n=1 Tax=Microbulbifer rhizosphaerae TaxID=1562603 RepID=A0A7W4WEU3_9GAMM|nr:AmpG family muropeptide MFS transporter [Microbulbifer rhizosphaerae]MBB3062940.1 PAT family beta-lactamase induction signal transducer AmpG [Microbulbifer rhizosphaerae]